MKPVVVVGGGLSGLAAAVELASRKIPVTVLEQRPSAGGRAYSFREPATGETIDNGQHALIAGYAHTFRFLRLIGTDGLLRVQPRPELVLHHPDRGFCRFRLARVPSPLHLLIGVMSTDLLAPSDRVGLLRAGRILTRPPEDDESLQEMTIHQWLDLAGQSREVRRSFWEPLAVSIVNERVDLAAALPFLRSLRTAFLGGWRNAALALPLVGLSELYVEPARRYLAERGGSVVTGADVVGIIARGDAVEEIRIRDGSTLACSAAILAVPSNRAEILLPEALRDAGFLAGMAEIPASPIVSIHLWFETDFMEQQVLGLVGRSVQWIFNKRLLSHSPGKGGYLVAVISAARDFAGLPGEKLVEIACEDLRSVYGTAVGGVRSSLVIREKRATYSSTPATERLRPGVETPLPNLFLAGDWTRTGFPATIEGAVMSGFLAADRADCFSRHNWRYS